MNRKKILDSMPTIYRDSERGEVLAWMDDVLDDFECLLNDIVDDLSITDVDDLGGVKDAKDRAEEAAKGLY